ncbi:DUF6191 domain-containing protein [Streptomyces sp. NPDC047999]|uniref:DUF6191 domain-containing protein n=1 Tax=Streptomyces sp. NPDC047999 TaxID=3365497 RepID=UPI00371B8DEB
MFNLFDEIFAPGRRHTEEERNRLALTREDPGDGAPGGGPIDLASGKVTIRRPAAGGAEAAGRAGGAEAAGRAEAAGGERPGAAAPPPEARGGTEE